MSTTTSKAKRTAPHRPAAKTTLVVRWRDDAPCGPVRPGARLSVESAEPFVLHFGHDGWQEVTDLASKPLGTGRHAALLDLGRVGVLHSLEFTRRFLGPRDWEHHDWQVQVDAGASGRSRT